MLVTSARDRLLPTILSRTQRVRFVPVRPAAILEIAEPKEIHAARRQPAAALAGGSVTRLLALARTTGGEGPWAQQETTRAGAASAEAEPVRRGAALGDKESKQRLPEVLALAAGFYRDVVVAALGAPDSDGAARAGPGD